MIRASKPGLTVCGVLYRQAMMRTKDMDTVEVLSLLCKKGITPSGRMWILSAIIKSRLSENV